MDAYFPPPTEACPTFDGDSEWHPLVDGGAYFAALDEALTALGAGDEILLTGLELHPELVLVAGAEPLGDRLVAAAGAGVDVRVLLAGKVTASFLPLRGLREFRRNRATCKALEAARPAGWPAEDAPPMEGHALVDYSGVLLGSNHQKSVIVTQGGEVTSFVGGIDLATHRLDSSPHDTLRLDGKRWGWHDIAVRLRGPAAARAHDVFLERWHEAATLAPRPYLTGRRPWPHINAPAAPPPPPAEEQKAVPNPEVAVRVLRSVSARKLDSVFPWRRHAWDHVPPGGIQEVFGTLTTAIAAARRYVYIEDQYLYEYAGGLEKFELYPHLRNAAARGVKVILMGSGTRDPDDPGLNLRPINSTINSDIRRKILAELDPERRRNVSVNRLADVTVHAKLTLIDDTFANIGSANLFSRSMAGVDCEISAACVTSNDLVRDLRVAVWGEHLRAPLTPELRTDLEDLDLALGIWDTDWLPADRPRTTWQVAGEPASFAPTERALQRVTVRR